ASCAAIRCSAVATIRCRARTARKCMQDQGKRLLLAVVLALGVLLVWQKFFGPKDDDTKKPGAGSGSAAAVVVSTAKATSQVGYAGEAPKSTPKLIELKFPQFVATFSSEDAALTSWKLTDDRYKDDATHGELVSGRGELIVGFTKDSTFKLPKNV